MNATFTVTTAPSEMTGNDITRVERGARNGSKRSVFVGSVWFEEFNGQRWYAYRDRDRASKMHATWDDAVSWVQES